MPGYTRAQRIVFGLREAQDRADLALAAFREGRASVAIGLIADIEAIAVHVRQLLEADGKDRR